MYLGCELGDFPRVDFDRNNAKFRTDINATDFNPIQGVLRAIATSTAIPDVADSELRSDLMTQMLEIGGGGGECPTCFESRQAVTGRIAHSPEDFSYM